MVIPTHVRATDEHIVVGILEIIYSDAALPRGLPHYTCSWPHGSQSIAARLQGTTTVNSAVNSKYELDDHQVRCSCSIHAPIYSARWCALILRFIGKKKKYINCGAVCASLPFQRIVMQRCNDMRSASELTPHSASSETQAPLETDTRSSEGRL